MLKAALQHHILSRAGQLGRKKYFLSSFGLYILSGAAITVPSIFARASSLVITFRYKKQNLSSCSAERGVKKKRTSVSSFIQTLVPDCNPQRQAPSQHPCPGCPYSHWPLPLSGEGEIQKTCEVEGGKRQGSEGEGMCSRPPCALVHFWSLMIFIKLNFPH